LWVSPPKNLSSFEHVSPFRGRNYSMGGWLSNPQVGRGTHAFLCVVSPKEIRLLAKKNKCTIKDA